MADINVLMVVDTKNINAENIDQTVFLMDDNLDSEGSNHFTITSNSGDNVQFRIMPVDMETSVGFLSFEWKDTGTDHRFNELPSADNGWCAKSVGAEGVYGAFENFSINFYVKEESNQLRLDPEIQVVTGG